MFCYDTPTNIRKYHSFPAFWLRLQAILSVCLFAALQSVVAFVVHDFLSYYKGFSNCIKTHSISWQSLISSSFDDICKDPIFIRTVFKSFCFSLGSTIMTWDELYLITLFLKFSFTRLIPSIPRTSIYLWQPRRDIWTTDYVALANRRIRQQNTSFKTVATTYTLEGKKFTCAKIWKTWKRKITNWFKWNRWLLKVARLTSCGHPGNYSSSLCFTENSYSQHTLWSKVTYLSFTESVMITQRGTME